MSLFIDRFERELTLRDQEWELGGQFPADRRLEDTRNLAEWFSLANSLTTMVLADKIAPSQALLMFGRAKGDDTVEFFNLTVSLLNRQWVNLLLINGSEEGMNEEGTKQIWPGKAAWTKRLISMLVRPSAIDGIAESFNTGDEAINFVLYCKAHGIRRAIVLAHCYQLARCLGSLVYAMQVVGWQMRIYCTYPECDFFEDTLGSQSAELKPRHEHIYDELLRMWKYSAPRGKGVATLEEIFEYLRTRDQIPD